MSFASVKVVRRCRRGETLSLLESQNYSARANLTSTPFLDYPEALRRQPRMAVGPAGGGPALMTDAGLSIVVIAIVMDDVHGRRRLARDCASGATVATEVARRSEGHPTLKLIGR